MKDRPDALAKALSKPSPTSTPPRLVCLPRSYLPRDLHPPSSEHFPYLYTPSPTKPEKQRNPSTQTYHLPSFVLGSLKDIDSYGTENR